MSAEFTTAFVVMVHPDGSPQVLLELDKEGFKIERQATHRDVRRACMEVSADLAAVASAEMLAKMLTPPQQPSPSEVVAEALARREEESGE